MLLIFDCLIAQDNKQSQTINKIDSLLAGQALQGQSDSNVIAKTLKEPYNSTSPSRTETFVFNKHSNELLLLRGVYKNKYYRSNRINSYYIQYYFIHNKPVKLVIYSNEYFASGDIYYYENDSLIKFTPGVYVYKEHAYFLSATACLENAYKKLTLFRKEILFK